MRNLNKNEKFKKIFIRYVKEQGCYFPNFSIDVFNFSSISAYASRYYTYYYSKLKNFDYLEFVMNWNYICNLSFYSNIFYKFLMQKNLSHLFIELKANKKLLYSCPSSFINALKFSDKRIISYLKIEWQNFIDTYENFRIK